MANLQNDLETGIATILNLTAFDAVLRESKTATSIVNTGYVKGTDPYEKYNGFRIIPSIVETPAETVFDDSALSVFHFDVVFSVNDLSGDNHETINAMSQLMVSKFADNGTNLSANITDNGTNLLDGTQVVTEIDPPELEPVDENGVVDPKITYPLRVNTWHKMPLA